MEEDLPRTLYSLEKLNEEAKQRKDEHEKMQSEAKKAKSKV